MVNSLLFYSVQQLIFTHLLESLIPVIYAKGF